jgi:hypothetical protein
MILEQSQCKIPEQKLYLELILSTIDDLSKAKYANKAYRFSNGPGFVACAENCGLSDSWIKRLIKKAFEISKEQEKIYAKMQEMSLLERADIRGGEPGGDGTEEVTAGDPGRLQTISPDSISSPAN